MSLLLVDVQPQFAGEFGGELVSFTRRSGCNFRGCEVLDNGKQWVIKKPAGTLMTRVLKETYDDGT